MEPAKKKKPTEKKKPLEKKEPTEKMEPTEKQEPAEKLDPEKLPEKTEPPKAPKELAKIKVTPVFKQGFSRFLYLGSDEAKYKAGRCKPNMEFPKLEKFESLLNTCDNALEVLNSLKTANIESPVRVPVIYSFAVLIRYISKEIPFLEARNRFYGMVPTILKNSEELFLFSKYLTDLGLKKGSRWQKCMQSWYNTHAPDLLDHDLTRFRTKYGWCHKDICNLLHIKSDAKNKATLSYIYNGGEAITPDTFIKYERLRHIHLLTKTKDLHAARTIVKNSSLKYADISDKTFRMIENDIPTLLILIERMDQSEVLRFISKLLNLNRLHEENYPSQKIKSTKPPQELIHGLISGIRKRLAVLNTTPSCFEAYIAYCNFKNFARTSKKMKKYWEKEAKKNKAILSAKDAKILTTPAPDTTASDAPASATPAPAPASSSTTPAPASSSPDTPAPADSVLCVPSSAPAVPIHVDPTPVTTASATPTPAAPTQVDSATATLTLDAPASATQATATVARPPIPKKKHKERCKIVPALALEKFLLDLTRKTLESTKQTFDVRCMITLDVRDLMFLSPKYSAAQTNVQLLIPEGLSEPEKNELKLKLEFKRLFGQKPAQCFHNKNIIPGQAAIFMALYCMKVMKHTTVAIFTHSGIQCVDLIADPKNPKLPTWEEVEKKIRTLDAGRAALHYPFQWASTNNKEFDLFITAVDTPTRMRKFPKSLRIPARDLNKALKDYRLAMKLPKTKAITMALSTQNAITAKGRTKSALDISGFDENIPKTLENFIKANF